MRALRLHAPKSAAVLEDVPQPEPGPGQVLVKVGAAGACHSDLHLMHDFETLGYPLPFTLGHENAGWVEALGPGVTGIERGTPVAVYGPNGCGRCSRCAAGIETLCEHPEEVGAAGVGLGFDGGMADYLLVRSPRHLVPLGDLDPVQAAPLTDAGLTPYHAIKRSLPRLVPGSTAVVIGAGGLGHLAVQLLRALSPARVVVVDAKEQALALATEVGAHHTVLAGDEAAEAVRGHSGGRGADLVLDLVGVDATLALAAAVARPLGDIALVGIGGGTLPFGFLTFPVEVNLASTYWGTLPELHELLALAAAGAVRAHVQAFPLEQAPQVYDDLHAGRLTGRAVIVP